MLRSNIQKFASRYLQSRGLSGARRAAHFCKRLPGGADKPGKMLLDDDAIQGRYEMIQDIQKPELTPEEINSLKNERIIRREFFNDTVGISLKYTSVLYGGPQYVS